MDILNCNPTSAKLRVHFNELQLLNNALNEVCNGIDIADFEFQTRLGVTREEARSLLGQINGLIKDMK